MVVKVDDPVEGPLRHVANPIKFDGRAYAAVEPAPQLGAHTEELFGEIGYSSVDIAEFKRAGVI